MVIDNAGSIAENLKELIEFMDAPQVCTAAPADWRTQIGDRHLQAIFIGPQLNDKDVHTLVTDIGTLDPNIPIVMLSATAEP